MKRLGLLFALLLALGAAHAATTPLANGLVLVDPATGLIQSIPTSGSSGGATAATSITAISGQAATSYFDKLTTAANTKNTRPNLTDVAQLVRDIPNGITLSSTASPTTSGFLGATQIVTGIASRKIVITSYTYSGTNTGLVYLYNDSNTFPLARGYNGPFSGEALSFEKFPFVLPTGEGLRADVTAISGSSTTFQIHVKYYVE